MDITALWISLVVCVPTFYLAGSLIELGMTWIQGLVTILIANIIVVVPIILNAWPGTRLA